MKSRREFTLPCWSKRWAIPAIISLGAVLRLTQYLTSNSMWLDELYIALNVTQSSWADLLFKPLAHNQVAPIGFLAVEKLATSIIGNTEIALRFFPSLFGLASLVLFWRVSKRFLDGQALLAALILFAINPVFLWTARNAKQYSGDVMVGLLLVLLALRFHEGQHDRRSLLIGGILAGLGILLSQPAVLVVPFLLMVLLISRLRLRERLSPLLSLMVGTGIVAFVVTINSLVLAPPITRSRMRQGWSESFIAAPWDDPFSMPRLLINFVAYVFGGMVPDTYPEIALSLFILGLVILGIVRLATSTPHGLALLAAPLAIAVIASAAHILPLSGRVAVYAGPSVVVAAVVGFSTVRVMSPMSARAFVTAVVWFVLVTPSLAQLFLVPPFHKREDARPVLERVRDHWQPGDVLYTVHGGWPAMQFYGESMGLVPWKAGGSHGFAPRAYLREVDLLRGNPRVWFFYTHAKWCQPEIVIDYLDSIGVRMQVIEDREGNRGKREAAAYLYDLSDPELLAGSSVASHPVPSNPMECERAPLSQGEIIKRKVRELVNSFT